MCDVFFEIAEEHRRVFAANLFFPVAGDLLSSDIESIDSARKIRGDETGANRGDDAFVQRAEICE
jgi:hypothetical protein